MRISLLSFSFLCAYLLFGFEAKAHVFVAPPTGSPCNYYDYVENASTHKTASPDVHLDKWYPLVALPAAEFILHSVDFTPIYIGVSEFRFTSRDFFIKSGLSPPLYS